MELKNRLHMEPVFEVCHLALRLYAQLTRVLYSLGVFLSIDVCYICQDGIANHFQCVSTVSLIRCVHNDRSHRNTFLRANQHDTDNDVFDLLQLDFHSCQS